MLHTLVDDLAKIPVTQAEIYWELKQQEYEDRIEKEAEEYFESREREYWALKELEKEADAEENG